MDAIDAISVERLAAVKHLDPGLLRHEFGLRDRVWYREPAVAIPVRDAAGVKLYDKLRLTDGTSRRMPSGGPYVLYGLERLARLTAGAGLVLVEGESDLWTGATHGVPAIGIPGAGSWRSEFAATLRGFRCVLWEEPDEAARKLVLAVARDLPDARVIAGDAAAKDLCALHQQVGGAFRRALRERLAHAVPISARAVSILASRPAVSHRTRYPLPSFEGHGRNEFDRLIEKARHVSLETLVRSLGFEPRGRGETLRLACPFHGGERDSLALSVTKGLWKCHACEAAGDVIAFVMQLKGVSFRDAVRELAT